MFSFPTHLEAKPLPPPHQNNKNSYLNSPEVYPASVCVCCPLLLVCTLCLGTKYTLKKQTTTRSSVSLICVSFFPPLFPIIHSIHHPSIHHFIVVYKQPLYFIYLFVHHLLSMLLQHSCLCPLECSQVNTPEAACLTLGLDF